VTRNPRDGDWTGVIFIPRFQLEPVGIRITHWQVVRSEQLFVPYSRITALYLRSGLIFVDVELHVEGFNGPITTRMLKRDARALERHVRARMP
jgi:hypothetical protein